MLSRTIKALTGAQNELASLAGTKGLCDFVSTDIETAACCLSPCPDLYARLVDGRNISFHDVQSAQTDFLPHITSPIVTAIVSVSHGMQEQPGSQLSIRATHLTVPVSFASVNVIVRRHLLQ